MKEYTVQVFKNRAEWFFDGKLHREDGPAIEYTDGTKYWYKYGLYHREEGPAIEYANGSKYWYLEGKQLTKEAFDKEIKVKSISTCDGKYVEVDGIKYKLVKI